MCETLELLLEFSCLENCESSENMELDEISEAF